MGDAGLRVCFDFSGGGDVRNVDGSLQLGELLHPDDRRYCGAVLGQDDPPTAEAGPVSSSPNRDRVLVEV